MIIELVTLTPDCSSNPRKLSSEVHHESRTICISEASSFEALVRLRENPRVRYKKGARHLPAQLFIYIQELLPQKLCTSQKWRSLSKQPRIEWPFARDIPNRQDRIRGGPESRFPESKKLNGTCASCCNKPALAAAEGRQCGCANPGEGRLTGAQWR